MVAAPNIPQTTKREYTGDPLADYAQAHHCIKPVFAQAGWKPEPVQRKGRPALQFTTTSGERFRFIDGNKPTYDQDKDYKPCWYGLKRAIVMSKQGVIVDCNGAASTIPAQWREVPAFSLQAGEDTSPDQALINELKSLWQGRIIVAMDCDRAGCRSAIKRVQLYRKHGLRAEAVDLGLKLDGGDLADFVALHKEPLTALLKCSRMIIPKLVEKPRKVAPETQSQAELYELTQQALVSLAGWRCDDHDTWYRVGMALKDGLGDSGLFLWDSWSAGSAKYKEGVCAKRWETFNRSDGNKITIGSIFDWAAKDSGWRPPLPKKNNPPDAKPNPKPLPVNNPTPFYWQHGLPISVRAALNAYVSQLAPVLELWVEAINTGMIEPDEPVDVDFLQCASEALKRKVGVSAIRRGLNQGAGQFLSNLSESYIYNTSNSIESSYYTSTGIYIDSDKNERNSSQCQTPIKAGRKATLYTLLPRKTILANLAKLAVIPILQKAFPLDNELVAPIRTEFLQELGCAPDEAAQLREQLEMKYGSILKKQPAYQKAMNRARLEYNRFLHDLNAPDSAPIPQGYTYSNTSQFQTATARALLEAHGGSTQFSQKELVAKIGCSLRNHKTVLKRAGITLLQEQIVDVPIKTIEQLKAVRGYNANAKGFPIALISSGKKDEFRFDVENRKMFIWAEQELKSGATVSVRYRQAHRQTLHATTEPAIEAAPVGTPKLKQGELFSKVTPLSRYFRAKAFACLIDWLWHSYCTYRFKCCLLDWIGRTLKRLNMLEEKPERHKLNYAELWIQKFTETVTAWQVIEDGHRMLDRSTGEVVPYGTQLALDLLVKGDSPPPEPCDPLLEALVLAGGVITKIEDTS